MPLDDPFNQVSPKDESGLDDPFSNVTPPAPVKDDVRIRPQPAQSQVTDPFSSTGAPPAPGTTVDSPAVPPRAPVEEPLSPPPPRNLFEDAAGGLFSGLGKNFLREGFSPSHMLDFMGATNLPIFTTMNSWLDDRTVDVLQGVRDAVPALKLRAMGMLSDKAGKFFSQYSWDPSVMPLEQQAQLEETGEWAKILRRSTDEAYRQHGFTQASVRYEKELQEMLAMDGIAPFRAVSRDFTRFLIPFMTFRKAVGPSSGMRNYVAAPIADITAFSTDEKRLSNMVAEAKIPVVSQAVGRYMASDPDDPEALATFKQAVEGVFLGKITDRVMQLGSGIYRGAKSIKAKAAGQHLGINPPDQAMPLSTPSGWSLEELDVQSATKARHLLSSDVQLAEGETPVQAITKMYQQRLKDAGIWEQLDQEDQVAKIGWIGARAKGLYDDTGKLKKKPSNVKPASTKKWNDLWEENRQKVNAYMESQIHKTPKQRLDSINQALVDRSGPLRSKLMETPEGQVAARRFALSAGANAKSSREADIAIREIYRRKAPGAPVWTRIPKDQKDNLNKLIMLRRFRQIKSYNPKWSEKGNPLTSQNEEFYSNQIEDMRGSLGEEQFADLMGRADRFFTSIRKPLDDLLDSGVISKDEWKNLSRFSYSPVKWIEQLDTPVAQFRGKDGKAISVNRSGILPLDKGTQKIIDTDTESFLEEVIVRSNSIAARNRANLAMYDLAKRGDSSIAQIKKPKGASKEDWVKIEVMKDGEAKPMYLAKEFAEQWSVNPTILNDLGRNILRYSSGAPVTRFFATGPGNPEFALSNFPRDVMYNILVSNQYSGFMPTAFTQYADDIAEVIPDAIARKGAYVDYINQGGGMEFLSQQGVPGHARSAHSATGDLENAFAYFNTTSEIINRLAVRNRALKNIRKMKARSQGIAPEQVTLSQDEIEQATFIARTTIDFDQGGRLAKGVNEAIPYFNAASQGIRGYARSWKENPAKAAAYAAQLMGVYASVHVVNRAMQPEAAADTPKYIRDNYLAVNTPLSFIDEEGDRRYLGIRIPVDHASVGLKIASQTLVDRSMNSGIPTDAEIAAIDQASRILSSQFGIVPGASLPPTISALMAYGANYDWWKQGPVWAGEQDIPNDMKFTEETPMALRDIGKATGLSPANMDSAIRQVIPDNIFSYGMGAAYQGLTKEVPRERLDPVEKDMIEKIQALPGMRKFTFLTSPHAKEADRVTESIEEGNRPQVEVNRSIDNLASKVVLGQNGMTMQDAMTWVKEEVPQELQAKAASRMIDAVQIEKVVQRLGYSDKSIHLPSRIWWNRLASAPPAARAKELALHLAALENLPEGKEKSEAKKIFSAMTTQVPGFSPKDSSEFALYMKRELERQGLNPGKVLN